MKGKKLIARIIVYTLAAIALFIFIGLVTFMHNQLRMEWLGSTILICGAVGFIGGFYWSIKNM